MKSVNCIFKIENIKSSEWTMPWLLYIATIVFKRFWKVSDENANEQSNKEGRGWASFWIGPTYTRLFSILGITRPLSYTARNHQLRCLL